MKAQDLRIGNYVTIAHESNTSLIKIETITEHFINVFDNRIGYDIRFVLPIPLTEEWFQKWNLPITIPMITLDDDYTVDLEFQAIAPCQDTNNKWQCWVWFNNAVLLKLDFVHQVQNAFYALTNKELPIKP